MSKVKAQDIIELGFTPEMFKKADATALTTFIDTVIAEWSKILEGKVSSATYAITTSPTAEQITRAEKCLVAAEMLQRRINIILENSVGAGQEIDITQELKQRKSYLGEAEFLIATTASSYFGNDVVITSNFDSG